VHDGRLEEITLPSQQYYLELQDTSVAVIDESTAVVMALKKGKTRVLLHDRNVDERETGIRLPSATLTVNDPCYLTLAILPHRNWIVTVNEHYEIIVEVYDRWEEFLDIYSGLQCIFIFFRCLHFHSFPSLLLLQFLSFHFPSIML
jgi:nuclear pore complex protein Nup210